MENQYKNIIINMPEPVKKALVMLSEGGYEAYIVGGCVRDSLLGRCPYDWDICTSAKPDEMKRIFAGMKTFDTGIKHGTITLLAGEKGDKYCKNEKDKKMAKRMAIEITTFRVDGKYSDGRRPDNVAFTANLREDLRRRDFTVNAMAYSATVGLIDFFGGRDDLCGKIIRCVGKGEERFDEDALRILRALRFSACLGFEIDKETESGIYKKKTLLKNVAKERCGNEIEKMICGKMAGQVFGKYLDVLRETAEEFALINDPSFINACFDRLAAFDDSSDDIFTRFGLMLSLIENLSDGKELLKSLRYSNKTIDLSAQVAEYAGHSLPSDKKGGLKLLKNIGAAQAMRVLLVKKAQGRDVSAAKALIEAAITDKSCFSKEQLKVNGRDIIAAGISGKAVGIILDILLENVIEGSLTNEKEALLQAAKQLHSKINSD